MYENLFLPANILLPKQGFEKWSVIACDQYTSDNAYWDEVKAAIGNAPSALHITFPEIYLSKDNSDRIALINANMKDYLKQDLFEEISDTLIYVERQTSGGIRRGVVGRIDLEGYSFQKKSDAPVRATEATVTERIPPRVEIRKEAPLEIPHVMLFIDDPNSTVIQPLSGKKTDFRKLYDFDLMQNGGHIKGFAIDPKNAEQFMTALKKLYESADGMPFAVGDGNHSLATAKECYALHKTEQTRYALVEIVNLHDPSIVFEPIYRVLFGADYAKILSDFITYCGGAYEGDDAQKFTVIAENEETTVSVKPRHPLSVGTLQEFLDSYLPSHPEISIDYIHGENDLRKLAKAEKTIGFLFDGMEKEDLFPAVRKSGSLPRKTFSMGQANDKRFYLEARKLS